MSRADTSGKGGPRGIRVGQIIVSNDSGFDRNDETAIRGEASPGIDVVLLRRVAAGDATAAAAFLDAVHDRACRMVEDALSGPPGRRPAVLDRLIRAYGGDDLEIQAALLSAQTSFRRHLMSITDADAIRDDRDYVTALISITYNRWQRQHYREKQLTHQAALGSTKEDDSDLTTTWLSRAPDPRPGPDYQPMVDDFYEKLVEEIELMSQQLRPGEPEIISLRLFEGMSYEEIGRQVGKSTATVGRVCQQAVTYLRQRFRDALA